MISHVNNSQHPTPASEVKQQPPRKPEPQAPSQKSGALSHDQVTLTNAGQVNGEEKGQ
ncbi:MAG TPA: hypothetical protein VGG04_04280 [Candidatus Sulfotelmatobacter sp.]|jgi:hypothetical protein